jgi:hypothetical protein
MDIERIAEIEQATGVNRKEVLRLGVSILFLAGIILYVGSQGEVSPMLIIAGMIGGSWRSISAPTASPTMTAPRSARVR